MASVRKILTRTLLLIVALYLIICLSLYFLQEKLIFFPTKLSKDYRFQFDQPFEELTIKTKTGNNLNGLLFTTDSSKGLLFYLHGNAGALDTWGGIAKTYTALGYDIFMLDYPGYGKSDGKITSEKNLFSDIQDAYDDLLKRYPENRIILTGYSIGSGPAAKLASSNHPKQLILQAPYYSLTDMMRHTYPIIPTFLLKYKFNTSEYLESCKMPVTIFHGDRDEVIYYGSSLKLQAEMKPGDSLITLKDQGHNGISENPEYVIALAHLLGTKGLD